MQGSRARVLSGIQPSSVPHLGNYLGAIRNWVGLQDSYDCFYLIVDLHAITVSLDPRLLRDNTYEMISFYLAAGLDPQRASLFLQSHVPQHAELGWVLTCFCYMGELSRMTQFKDKSKRQGANIGVGLFAYPTLMAADILLYEPQFVPVGDDQKQHIELTRDLAERLNSRFQRELLKVPQPLIHKAGARIMDLQDPESKMSKSAANLKGVVFMNESDKDIAKKFKSAMTDSGSAVGPYEEAGPGIRNLIDIHASLSGKSHSEVAAAYAGKQYGYLKVDTADLAVAVLGPLRDEAARYKADHAYLAKVLAQGAERAQEQAHQVLQRIHECVGFIPRPDSGKTFHQ